MFKQIFLLGFICLAQANVITQDAVIPLDNKAIKPREQDQGQGEEFLEKFYQGCGTIRPEIDPALPQPCSGPRCPEIVKRCIGDRENCIEDKNCYFGISIEESAHYDRTPNDDGTFKEYTRTVDQHVITILDTCHLKPQAVDETPKTEKLIAVGLAVLDKDNKPNCETADPIPVGVLPSIEDYRGYFFVSNFSQCSFDSGLPVHPADLVNENGNVYEADTITNTLTYKANQWQGKCNGILPTIPANPDFTKQSQLLQFFALTYYGTTAPATPASPYTIEGGFTIADAAETKATQMYLYPKSDERVIEIPVENSGILFMPSSAIITATLIFSAVKSLF